ncbi:hypothetical protein [Kluyvera sp. CRP]|uniref:hypothetical protein n=1 Tax=Kluyvera sp. CRP TaxID=2873269 RepID=UPI001CC1DB3B|nr:hypothetical protein [Kluyvera sp. CRP]UAK18535.1 hypothetical protein K7B04_14450 [Kluyvera sp. CRP]
MNVKELIAKFRLSHIMCISIGVLIPIYSDVLFLHEFTSSTVSAIMDTVVAASVIFAAWSVRNWTKEKINGQGFQHAEKILSNLHQSYVMLSTIMFCLDEFHKDYIIYKTISEHDEKNMGNESKRLIAESNKLNIKLSEIVADLYSLRSWSMECTQESEYSKYINGAEEVRNRCHLLLSVVHPRANDNMREQWYKTFRNIRMEFDEIRSLYLNLEIRFQEVFKSESTLKN